MYMKKRIITVDDVIRANDRLMGKIDNIVLSDEDKKLFDHIRRTLPLIQDSHKLRMMWKNARTNNV